MELSNKVKNILLGVCKDLDIEGEETLFLNYDLLIKKLKLDYLEKDKLKEYYDLQKQLMESITRKYVYLLIEKVKNNLDEPEAKEVAEIIKDKDFEFLSENIDRILKEYSLDDLIKAKEEDTEIRMKYLQDLIDKKHLMILLELLEAS